MSPNHRNLKLENISESLDEEKGDGGWTVNPIGLAKLDPSAIRRILVGLLPSQ